MFPIKVLADEVVNLTDARYFSARGVDYICLNDPKDAGRIQPAEAVAIASWLDGPELLLHYHDKAYFDEMRSGLALGGVICWDQKDRLQHSGEEEWLRFLVYEVFDFESLGKEGISGTDVVLGYDYIILDVSKTGKTLEELVALGALPILQAICAAAPVFLKASVSAESLAGLIDEIQPEGWVVSGGEEDKVGFKNYDELDLFFDALEMIEL